MIKAPLRKGEESKAFSKFNIKQPDMHLIAYMPVF
jgi:hypothetical protein